MTADFTSWLHFLRCAAQYDLLLLFSQIFSIWNLTKTQDMRLGSVINSEAERLNTAMGRFYERYSSSHRYIQDENGERFWGRTTFQSGLGKDAVLYYEDQELSNNMPYEFDLTYFKQHEGGNFGERIENPGRDEVGEVARSFNDMAQCVEEHVKSLAETNEKQRRLLRALAHEPKTPMTGIQGYAELLQRVELSAARQQAALGYIEQECKRLSRLSAKLLQLMELSREGQPEMEQENFLTNLIDNAAKASMPGSTIWLTASEEGIFVRDEGEGIPEEELEKITEPFYMADKSRSRQEGGAGLGLALCEQIARLHGGKLRITSKLGKGTEALEAGMDSQGNGENVPKDAGNSQNALKGSANVLAQKLQVPDRYVASAGEGIFSLDCDAEILVPDVEKVSVWKVSQKEFSQEWIDQVTEAFFGDRPVYNGGTYFVITKDQALEQLNQLKTWQAEGNLDPYGSIAKAREDGDTLRAEDLSLQSQIDRWEEIYANASEETDRTEVKPMTGAELLPG